MWMPILRRLTTLGMSSSWVTGDWWANGKNYVYGIKKREKK
jgi:hypothetical protein